MKLGGLLGEKLTEMFKTVTNSVLIKHLGLSCFKSVQGQR